MSFSFDLSGKSAIVTGGTRGIGLSIAEHLLRAGAKVIVASRKADAVQAAVASLSPHGAVRGFAANVGEANDRASLIEECITAFGSLDILINNAAANPVYGKVEDTEPWAFEKIMQVNVHAPFELARLALPHFERAGAGNVLNISSIGGLSPEPGLGIYSVSKAALNSLTKVLASEWGPRGVRVNSICPGLIKTDFSQALWSDERVMKHMERQTPLRRIGAPSEIGALAAFVVSDACGFATGQTFTADGGYTI